MSKKGAIKHVFPGGNTTKGFYSYYDFILGQEEATRIICIKGGPGVGKSTFMKKVGNEMVERGYDVEFMHCSSDPNSLDGVLIKDINVALIDATSPHVVDPKNPGAVDEILHLGDYWNEDGIRQHKKDIININRLVSKRFNRAYKYLAASKSIYDDIVTIYDEAVNKAGINLEVNNIITSEFRDIPVSDHEGKIRKLFASAITPDGLINYLDNILGDYENVYILKGEIGTKTESVLARIMYEVVQRGADVEAYYCPMEPDKKIEHLLIPKLNMAFTTSNNYHSIKVDSEKIIDMNKYVDKIVLAQYENVLQYDLQMFEQLLTKTTDTIKEAKELHDEMEKMYIPYMNFDGVGDCRKKIIKRILEYAKEYKVSPK